MSKPAKKTLVVAISYFNPCRLPSAFLQYQDNSSTNYQKEKLIRILHCRRISENELGIRCSKLM